MCPNHTRRLLHDAPYYIPSTVYRYVTATASARLFSRRPPGRCPACLNAEWALGQVSSVILESLGVPRVTEAFRLAGGFCLPHLLDALPRLGTAEALVAVEVCLNASGEQPPSVATEAGADRDAPLRGGLRERLPLEPGGDETTLGRLRARMEVDACPLCLAAAQAERCYLTWAIAKRAHEARELARDLVTLCPRHTHDLFELDREAGAWVVDLKREFWLRELRALTARLHALPPASFGERLRQIPRMWHKIRQSEVRQIRPRSRWRAIKRTARELLHNQRRAREDAVRRLLVPRECPACRAVQAVERQQQALLGEALSDRETLTRYENSHGVCLYHLRSFGVVPEPVSALAATRLAVLNWELVETGRKRNWIYRHESGGSEASAWLRAPALLDGRTFLGGPATRP